eukprot:SAG31_NODE_225_length_19846_cov_19.057983_13_plen_62_part_00
MVLRGSNARLECANAFASSTSALKEAKDGGFVPSRPGVATARKREGKLKRKLHRQERNSTR